MTVAVATNIRKIEWIHLEVFKICSILYFIFGFVDDGGGFERFIAFLSFFHTLLDYLHAVMLIGKIDILKTIREIN